MGNQEANEGQYRARALYAGYSEWKKQASCGQKQQKKRKVFFLSLEITVWSWNSVQITQGEQYSDNKLPC